MPESGWRRDHAKAISHGMSEIASNPIQAVSPATRKVMQANKRRDTKPELKVRSLHAHGFRFRVDKAGLPGRPDIALAKHRVAIFVHGCYWHGHDCGKGPKPKTNAAFWTEKFARNAARHERDAGRLAELGWRVVVVWECDLKDMDRAMAPPRRTAARTAIHNGGSGSGAPAISSGEASGGWSRFGT